MMLPSYVKPQPTWWKLFPFLKNFSGNTIYPYIYLRQDLYDGLQQKKFFPQGLSILEHEKHHIQQHKKIGVIKYRIKYICSPKFRFQQELEAYTITMRILKNITCHLIQKKLRDVCRGGCMYGVFHIEMQEKH